jgi:hypothetical protein
MSPPKHPKILSGGDSSRKTADEVIGTTEKRVETSPPDPVFDWAFHAPRRINKLPVMSVPEAAGGLSRLLGHANGSLGHGWPLFRTTRRGQGDDQHNFVGAIAFTAAVGAGLTIVTMQLGRKTSPKRLIELCVRDEVGLAWIGGSVTVDVNSEAVHVEGAASASTVVPGISSAEQVDFVSDPVTAQVHCTFDGGALADGVCVATGMQRNALLYPLVLNSQTESPIRHVTVDAIHGPVVKPRILQRRSARRKKPRPSAAASAKRSPPYSQAAARAATADEAVGVVAQDSRDETAACALASIEGESRDAAATCALASVDEDPTNVCESQLARWADLRLVVQARACARHAPPPGQSKQRLSIRIPAAPDRVH